MTLHFLGRTTPAQDDLLMKTIRETTGKVWPEIVAGNDPWPSILDAVPQTYGEAVALWGADVVACEPHEWDNRTVTENAVWLLCRLHVGVLLKRCKESLAADELVMESLTACQHGVFDGGRESGCSPCGDSAAVRATWDAGKTWLYLCDKHAREVEEKEES